MNIDIYKEFRKVGYGASRAKESASILEIFQWMEETGKVRIRTEVEEDYYPCFDMMEERDIQNLQKYIDMWGCFYVTTEFLTCKKCGTFEHADSIGFCVYQEPENPFENEYVIDMMDRAIKQYYANVHINI